MKRSMLILCVVALLTGLHTYSSADLTDGLVASYPFNGSAVDETGNGYDGMIHGATFSVDRFGNPNSACEVIGNEGPYGSHWIELPDMIEGFGSLTISVWINEYNLSYEHGGGYIWFGREYGISGDYKAVYIAHWAWPTNLLSFVVSTPIEIMEITVPWSSAWQNQWEHYTLVYDGTAGKLSAYQNGNLVGEKTTSTPGEIVTTESYAGLSTHWGGGGEKYHRFNGKFDDVLIYDRALSASEVEDLYYAPNPFPQPPFCVASSDELQNALTAASTNGQDDIIQIVQGTYLGNFVYASTEPYGVTIEGGYTASCASRVVDPLNTHLDGSRTGRVLVLSSTAVVSQFAVDGLTIRNGYLSNQSRNGLYVSANGGSVTITNTRITENAGGSYITGAGTVTFVQNDLSLNESFGVLVHPSENIVLESNTIHDNYGLGVLLESPKTASLKNNTITDNVCFPPEYFYCGGARISCSSDICDSINVENNRIDSNKGSGLQVSRATSVTIANNIITNNVHDAAGGILVALYAEVEGVDQRQLEFPSDDN